MKYLIAFLQSFLLMQSVVSQTDPYESQRQEMVLTQLVSRGITSEEVNQAIRSVPRHLFVPEDYRKWAHSDQPLPIGEGQTISQPYIVAFMTEILAIRPGEKILEIGTGSGYQAAILAEMGAEVFSVEIVSELAQRAQKTLRGLGYTNIRLKCGDGFEGWPEYAPYHAILVTCSPSRIPDPLKQQLAEGGRMIIPVGKNGWVQSLCFLQKKNGKITEKNVLPVRFVPMVDPEGKNY